MKMKILQKNPKKKLDDGRLDDYYLENPREQFFYSCIANLMSFFSVGDRGLWGYTKNTTIYEINTVVMAIFGPVCSISQLVFLYVNYSDLGIDTLGIMYTVMPVTALANANIFSAKMKSYKRISKIFFDKVHVSSLYREGKDEFVRQKVIAFEKITRWTIYCLFFFFLLNGIAWSAVPVINNVRNEELVLNHSRRLQTCLHLWMPFDYGYNYRNWYIMHSINIYIIWCGVLCTMAFQFQNYMFVVNLMGHLHILKHSLRTKFTENLRDEEIRERLGKIIEHHSFILRIFKEVQNAFGFNVATTYMQNLLSNSIVMYQIMYGGKENTMMFVLIVISYTGVPILMSFVIEELRRKSVDLPDVVYNIPWENMSVSNQKTVMLVLQRSQEPLGFVAFFGVKAGLGTMGSILKTTFSYYVMLESSIEK